MPTEEPSSIVELPPPMPASRTEGPVVPIPAPATHPPAPLSLLQPADKSVSNGEQVGVNIPVNTLNTSPLLAPHEGLGKLASLPICKNCHTQTTPLWRRDESGSVLCNACGLFLKLHGRPRPISLKTDVIKSRNRVKAEERISVKKRKKRDDDHYDSHFRGDETAHAVEALETMSHFVGDMSASYQQKFLLHPPPPPPREVVDAMETPLKSPSPVDRCSSKSELDRLKSSLQDKEEIIRLKTRVTELELVNDLYKRHITELESVLRKSASSSDVPSPPRALPGVREILRKEV